MKDFLEQAFTMPTTVWSVLLILVVVFWAVRLLTGLGGDLDLDLDLDADLGLDPDLGLDAEVAGLEPEGRGSGRGRGWVRVLGFGEVPAVLVISSIVAFGWAFSFGGARLASRFALLAAGGLGAMALVALVSVVLALAMTMVAVTPLRRMLHFVPATERRQLVGRSARITTLRVDDHFGQAEVDDAGGAPILIQARATGPNDFTRGDLVTVASYDPGNEEFVVMRAADGD